MEFKENDGGRATAGFDGCGEVYDCACRSISIVTETPYADVHKIITEKVGDLSWEKTGPDMSIVRSVFKRFGFVYIYAPKSRSFFGEWREKDLPKGRIAVYLSHVIFRKSLAHMVAVVDGVGCDGYDFTVLKNQWEIRGYFISKSATVSN